MAGLLAARRGLSTQTTRMAVISQNVANADNPDYSRQKVVDQSVPAPYPSGGVLGQGGPLVGGGVSAVAVLRERASWIEARLRQAAGETAGAQVQQEALKALQEAWGEPGDDGSLSHLFQEWGAAVNDWSGHPDDKGVKRVVVERSEDLAAGIRRLAGLVDQTREDQNAGLESDVKRVNELLHQLAETNHAIIAGEAGSEATGQLRLANDARDRRDALLRELAQYAPFRVVAGAEDQARDGAFRLELGGAVLVDGDQLLGEFQLNRAGATADDPRAATLEWHALPGQPPANQRLDGEVLGKAGRWAARLELRDQILTNYAQHLDTLAQNLADGINAFQTNPVLFVGSAGTTEQVRAADIHVNGSRPGDSGDLFVDPDKLDPGAGNGKVLDWLGWIKPEATSPQATATWFQSYSALVAQLGADVQRSDGMVTTTTLRQDNLQSLRQARSGVSLDEEMADLMSSQRAYTAAVRVLQTLDQALGDVIDQLGGR